MIESLSDALCPSGECEHRAGGAVIHTRQDHAECVWLRDAMEGDPGPSYGSADPERDAYLYDVPSHWRY